MVLLWLSDNDDGASSCRERLHHLVSCAKKVWVHCGFWKWNSMNTVHITVQRDCVTPVTPDFWSFFLCCTQAVCW